MFTAAKSLQFTLLAIVLLLFSPVAQAQTLDFLTVTPSDATPGAMADYLVEFRSGADNPVLSAGNVAYRLDFPDDPIFANPSFSSPGIYETREGPGVAPYPAYSTDTVVGGSISGSANQTAARLSATQTNTPGSTWYRDTFVRMRNPTVPGTYPVQVQLASVSPSAIVAVGVFNVVIGNPIVQGVRLDASPAAPLTYANEIIATPAAPVVLANPVGALNLSTALGYSFSAGEVRYARVQCDAGLRFETGSTAVYDGAGTASLGAINGLGTSAIHFSVTASDNAVASVDRLVITGTRRISGTDPVGCTYGLYDFPSQAAAGGTQGRVATVTGGYIDFAQSTTFTATPRTSVASVLADPSYSSFVVDLPTTAGTAALARLTYGLATPAPLKADGTAIALVDLHATGASGTRIVVDGDFSAAANADGSYTGGALSRVYLSANNATCVAAGSTPAASVTASRAVFNVGATATDRMLCLTRQGERLIPVSDYTATLDAVSAAPTVYAVDDIGPRNAGSIVRDGTQLQAPLVQVPNGWLSRVALTNTGGIARTYTIQVLGETGNTITPGTTLTGTVPAKGTRVIDLRGNVLSAFTQQPRATLVVNVAGPSTQIQGLYQIVNPQSGSISNHVMVRPGRN